MQKRDLCLFGLVVAMASPSLGMAQLAPTNVSPGAVIQTIQPSETQKLPSDPLRKPVKIEQEQLHEAPSQPALTTVQIQVNRITVQGVTLLDEQAVQNIVAPYEGKQLTLAQLQAVAKELTGLYQQKGYVTSRAFLPAQEIEDGNVMMQASEGLVGDINIVSGNHFKPRAIRGRISLESGEPLNLNDLKRTVSRINENPDLKVKASLKAGDKAQETDVQITMEDQRPIHLTPSFDNMGRRLIGLYRFGVGATHNNLLGFGDRSITSLNWTTRTFSLSEHYEVPLEAF